MNTFPIEHQITFTHHTMDIRVVARIRGTADNMGVASSAKNNFGVITVTVQCDTPHEHRLLRDMVAS